MIWPTPSKGDGSDANMIDYNGFLGIKKFVKLPQCAFLNITINEVVEI